MTAAQLAASPAHFEALTERRLPCCSEILRAAAAGRNFRALEYYQPQIRRDGFAVIAREAVGAQCMELVQWTLEQSVQALQESAEVFELWKDMAMRAIAAEWRGCVGFLLNRASLRWIVESAADLFAQACAHAQLAVAGGLVAAGFAVDWNRGFAAAAEARRVDVLNWLWSRHPLEPDELEDLYKSVCTHQVHAPAADQFEEWAASSAALRDALGCISAPEGFSFGAPPPAENPCAEVCIHEAGTLAVLDWLWGRGARRPGLVLFNALSDNYADGAQWALKHGADYYAVLSEMADYELLNKTLTVAGALWDPARHSASTLIAIGMDRNYTSVLEWCVQFCPGTTWAGVLRVLERTVEFDYEKFAEKAVCEFLMDRACKDLAGRHGN